ncbi:uncharacterized protein LOC113203189 isoform X1 [Frankliniella occidentalis]|uniref:Uncharacterized protein LOC113203189 isoform X1 n=2 Tax=Frankliniella occidentalis TaxID=133901 RepID=A0A6J1RX45_FRAOC|nr:uncharacterized protein LOC113203189 isoform X1 [Frankliniella occidentalis]
MAPWLVLCAALASLCRGAAAATSSCRPGEQCVSLDRCPAALQGLRERPPRRPQQCGFSEKNPHVPNVCCAQRGSQYNGDDRSCPDAVPELNPFAAPAMTCEELSRVRTPDQNDRRPGALARRMCRKHQDDLCALPKEHFQAACPAFGVPVDILEFPHMALLGYGDRDDLQFACGGSLIAPDFILTAAHCARLSGQPASWALLGATNRTSREPKVNDTHQLIKVAEVIVHPEYVGNLKYHDIALLRLERPVRVKAEEVYPACLDTDVDLDNTGQEAVATGWGATGYLEDASQTLIRVNLTVRNLQYCRDNVDLQPEKLPRGLVDDTQMCAGGGEDNQDTCQGDSGGPLQMRANPKDTETCIYRIIGVVSFGPPCGLGKPGIYTRVAAYVPWIERIVWPTRSDGCVNNVRIKFDNREVRLPDSGPGTIARGVCRAYHVEFCPAYQSFMKHVKPDLTLDSACHHNHPSSYRHREWEVRNHGTVSFRYGDNLYNRQHSCAGALVSPSTVLTAGRCAALGCLPLTQVTMNSPSDCTDTGIADVDKIIVHPEYRRGRAYADLAVVTLTKSFDLRQFFPLCLNTLSDVALGPGLRASAAGYNIQGTWENMYYVLPNNTLTVRTPKKCSSALLSNDRLKRALPDGYSPSLLCAGGLCDNDTYSGDSGTPLTHLQYVLHAPSGEQYVDYVLGVASSLTYCTARDATGRRLPDLFADVAQHIAWVERTVWPDP